MNIPSSFPEILFLVVLITPGATYSLVRRRVLGWEAPDHSVASRLFDALFVSIVFDALYLVLLLFYFGWEGGSILERVEALVTYTHGGVLALSLTVLLLLVPSGVGYCAAARFKRIDVETKNGATRRKLIRINRARSTPRAWDHAAFRAYKPCFVRVRTENGHYYGGWFDTDSLVSTYPFARDIFIAVAWKMGESGEFLEPMPDTTGIWIPITDGCIVEWVDTEAPTNDKNGKCLRKSTRCQLLRGMLSLGRISIRHR